MRFSFDQFVSAFISQFCRYFLANSNIFVYSFSVVFFFCCFCSFTLNICRHSFSSSFTLSWNGLTISRNPLLCELLSLIFKRITKFRNTAHHDLSFSIYSFRFFSVQKWLICSSITMMSIYFAIDFHFINVSRWKQLIFPIDIVDWLRNRELAHWHKFMNFLAPTHTHSQTFIIFKQPEWLALKLSRTLNHLFCIHNRLFTIEEVSSSLFFSYWMAIILIDWFTSLCPSKKKKIKKKRFCFRQFWK